MPSAPFTFIEYPSSDGKPMGETDLHRDEMVRQIDLLKNHFRGQKVYVSGDILLYYEEGNPKKFIVPDVFFTRGLTQRRRRTYQLWVERLPPNLVIETTSKKTKSNDLKKKPLIYSDIGVQEYFLFDPTSDYLDPPLRGFRLSGKSYVDIQPEPDGSLRSEQLKHFLVAQDDHLDFIDCQTHQRRLTSEEHRELEAEARRREAEARQREAEARQREAEARQRAESEVQILREEIRRLKGETD